MESLIKLSTSDGKEYQLEKSIICQSNLIKNMLQDLEMQDNTIPLPNITSSIMDIVVQYASMHIDDEPETTNDISKADRTLMDVPHKILFDIVLAANYLDFPGLLDLGCRCIAEELKGKSIDEIQTVFVVNLGI